MTRLTVLLACLALAALAAACGDDDEQEAAAPETTATATPAPASSAVDPAAVGDDLGTKPKIAKPSGSPPARLVSEDVKAGKGPAAKAGDTVSVQYVGVSWSTGREFDSSWSRGREPFAFALGAGQVIPGWDQGVAGMKPGGRRLLVLPPDLAYGAQSPSPDIAPNETLIFVVDLEKVS